MNNITHYLAVLSHINDKNFYHFGGAKTPGSTVSAALCDYIRNGDSRVQDGGTYVAVCLSTYFIISENY